MNWLGRLVLTSMGAFGIWAFVVSHVVIHWVDSPQKLAAAAALGLALATIALVATFSARRAAWLRAWVALLLFFAVGEAHRAWLRHEYRADSTRADPWRPVTTTHLEVHRFALETPSFGAAHLRVLHLSDLHITDATSAFDDQVASEMRAAKADLILMTGDYVSRAERLPALQRWLSRLPKTPLGAFAVLGNHDYWTGCPNAVRDVLERAGIQVISGRCVAVSVSSIAPLSICGTEEPWGPGYWGAAEPPAAGTTWVLSHTPDNVYALAERGVSAVFSGHTHGGQIDLPFLGAVVVPSNYGRRFDEGHFIVGSTHLFVSAGVGADAPALRLWCSPELLVVDVAGTKPSG